MSNNSRISREAKKRSTAKTGAGKVAGIPIEPHAELRDQQGQLLAGIVRRDGEWVLGMDGKIVGETTSAARVLALIMQAAELHERNGTPVRLMYSDALKDAAHAEAQAEGKDFEQFRQALATELKAGNA